MKKTTKFVSVLLSLLLLAMTACSIEPKVNSVDITQPDIKITTPESNWAFITYSLSDYNNKKVTITFSAEMKVTNRGSSPANLMWQINTSDYPVICQKSFPNGTSDFVKVEGTAKDIQLGSNNSVYLSTYQLNTSDLTIEIKNVSYSITAQGNLPKPVVVNEDDYWLSDKVPSLYQTYKNLFDYIGIAVGYNGELNTSEVQKGLVKHTNSITMGNEFKPQFICQWWGNNPQTNGTFTATNGKTIKTPTLNFSNVDEILRICKNNKLKMRGHVLVWHSQTEDAFFCEDYNKSKSLVSKDEMTARQEWYIKTVLEHVAEWEQKNNNGEHIIWAWDVVNEAIADGSSGSYRNTGSKWWDVYKSDEFIVNAFRFANKYAPKDVLLCYNDYNCTESAKRNGMLKLIDAVQKHQNDETLPTRIDVMGMQSHISKNTSSSDYQSAINDFTKKGLDIHVTELDVATETSYNSAELAKAYNRFFKLFVDNRKTSSKHGITSITIWGINDESTWLNTPSQMQWHGNTTQYPLLFIKPNGKYYIKEAFTSVIDAAK